MFPFVRIAYYKTQIAHKTASSILHKPQKSCRYAFPSDVQSFYPSGLCQSLYLDNPDKPLNPECTHLLRHLIHYQYIQSAYHRHKLQYDNTMSSRGFYTLFPSCSSPQIHANPPMLFYRHFFIEFVNHYLFPHRRIFISLNSDLCS